MVIASATQRRAGHVQVDHPLGAAGDGRHREAAGVGEQVEHALAGRVVAHPAAAVAHVQEQPVVLLAAQVELVGQAVLVDRPAVQGLAEQEFGRAVGQVAQLQQQMTRAAVLPGRGFAHARQHGAQRLQFLRRRLAEQRHQQHAFQPVDGELLQPRPAAAAPMQQTAGFVRRRGQGVEQALLQRGEGVGGHRWHLRKKAGIVLASLPPGEPPCPSPVSESSPP